MITGIVNADREARIGLTIRGANGGDYEVETVIDTGFNGSLTLPATLIASLGLSWQGREQGILGDGSIGLFDVYAVSVVWDGRDRIVEVAEADTQPLIGMGMLERYELRIQVVEGGRVVIETLS